MPIECDLLREAPVPLASCPECHAEPFAPFIRGMVQRPRRVPLSWPPFKLRPYCALICESCKHIVGYEAPTPETD